MPLSKFTSGSSADDDDQHVTLTGRRRHVAARRPTKDTVLQIADRLGVSRATIYRHLDPDKPVSA